MNAAPHHNPSSPPKTSSMTTRAELLALPNLFLFHLENRRFLDGTTTRTARPFYKGAATIGIVVILCLCAYATSDIYNFFLFKTSALITQGNVMERKREETSDESGTTVSYYIVYQFSPSEKDSRFYSGRATVTKEMYDSVSAGTPVLVTYVSQDPTRSLLGDTVEIAPYHGLAAIFVASLISLRTLWLRRQDQRLQWLEREGIFVIGEALFWKIRVVKDESDYLKITLRYKFRAPDQQRETTTETTQIVVDRDVSPPPAPTIGTPVAILYLNDYLYEVL
jgi:hypothetical protein